MRLVYCLIICHFSLINSQCISFHNTIYNLAGNNCGERCIDRNVENLSCTNSTAPGCYCKPGYFRDPSWNCIPGQMCEVRYARTDVPKTTTVKPEKCPPNELFSDCGNYCTEMCRNINDEFCPQNICATGCFCIDGYFRLDTGVCVPQPSCGVEIKPQKDLILLNVCPFNEHHKDCGFRCNEQCASAVKLKCSDEKCSSGCFCDTGYIRDINGMCVPKRECRPPGTCGRNEDFSLCGNSCAELCNPPAECPNRCEPGCFCKKGFFRNNRRKCVNDKTVLRTTHVMAKSLSSILSRNILRCELPSRKPVKKLRRLYGRQLGRRCGANEEFKECGNRCGQSCESLGKDIICPKRKICIADCYCLKGFHRNGEDMCVPKDKCKSSGSANLDVLRKRTQLSCQPETEEYRECGNHCEELCLPPLVCPGDCVIGCFCKKGLFRNQNGNCIPEKSCQELPKIRKNNSPSQCGPKEKWTECSIDCILTCNDLNDKSHCPRRKKCIQGCLCARGHYRNDDGQCVKEDSCANLRSTHTPIHPSSQSSDSSSHSAQHSGAQPAPPGSPGSPVQVLVNVNVRTSDRDRGKRDKSRGSSRGQHNRVVPNCAINEEYLTCGSYCIEMCKPPNLCTKDCQPGCFCRRNYLRNEKGNCVKKSKCNGRMLIDRVKIKIKDKCLKQNEVIKCGNSCGNTCEDMAKFVMCPNRAPCRVACFCAPGFYRDEKKECVPIDKCTPKVGEFKPPVKALPKPDNKPKCPKNELFDNCGDSCLELCKPPDSCDTECSKGCFCEPGFYRSGPGKPCMPEDSCPKDESFVNSSVQFVMKIKIKCEANEIYSECGTRCGQMCADLFKTVICPKKGLCVGGCFCAHGFFRNDKGKCVLESQCPDPSKSSSKKPLQCDANETYKECGDRCQQSCEHHLKKVTCSSTKKCSSGCFCNEGFHKDQYGNCVEPKDCTDSTLPLIKPVECTKHEEFQECGNRCGQTCEDVVLNKTCSNMRSCASGCFCVSGYLRSNDGTCIPKDDCYKQPSNKIVRDIKCEYNEEYYTCEVRCGKGCDDLGRKVDCPKIRQCASGCFCKESYFRNERGECVPESECPEVGPPEQIPKKLDCGPNEKYNECGTRCGQACDDLSRKVTCPKRRICISGCFCTEGYFRNYAGVCVPMLECPEISPPKRTAPTCDGNEEFNECGRRCGQSCDDYTFKKMCPKKQVCVTGCFCDSEHRRDFNGDCVPTNKCPTKDRYEVDPKTIKCGKNEEYTECGTRCGQGCEDLHAGASGNPCTKTQACVSGCFCSPGYYRNEIGECVPEKECPPVAPEDPDRKCGENEKYTDCGSNCAATCDSDEKSNNCPRKRMCIPGCFCKKGYLRDKYDNCVTKRQCKEGGNKGGKGTDDKDKDSGQPDSEPKSDPKPDPKPESRSDISSGDSDGDKKPETPTPVTDKPIEETKPEETTAGSTNNDYAS